jgi:hypothetical protein
MVLRVEFVYRVLELRGVKWIDWGLCLRVEFVYLVLELRGIKCPPFCDAQLVYIEEAIR